MTLWWTIATAAAAGSSVGFGGGLLVLTAGWDLVAVLRSSVTRRKAEEETAKRKRAKQVYADAFAAQKVREAKRKWDWDLAEWKRRNGLENRDEIV